MAAGKTLGTGMTTLRTAAMAAVLLAALAAQATVRHVDFATGADSGDGATGTPWKTLKYAAQNADAGDEIVLASGTHTISSDITIDKALVIHGTGAMDDTILDANHGKYTITISAADASIGNLQFYRLGGASYHQGFVVLSGNSTISDCRFTGCGISGKSSHSIVKATAGLISRCFFTGNTGDGSLGVWLPSGNAVVENCLFTGNTITKDNMTGKGFLYFQSNNAIARNCTIVGNTMKSEPAVYSGGWNNTDGYINGQLYNCIAYNNLDASGAQKNWYTRGLANNATSRWRGNCFDSLVNGGNTVNGPAANNVAADPQLDADGKPTRLSPEAIKNGATTGADCLAETDILGVFRGDAPSRGAYQYVAASGLDVIMAASATEVRLPETIILSLTVEGASSENLTYAWDIDGDGTVDGMDPTNVLNRVGTYDSVSVTVSDGTGTVTATYDGTLTVLQEHLVVSIVPNATTVRYPSNLVFRAEVANAYEGPLTYSWDTDGDGVADSTSSNVVYSTPGSHAAPTLLAIADQNGRRKENVTLVGTFYIHPAEALTYYVDYVNGNDAADGSAAQPWKTLAFAASCAYVDDGDEIVLKRGTHRVSGAVAVAKALRIHGEGEKEETILDANNTNPGFNVSATGAYINNLTFCHFGGNYATELVKMTGNSVVSNVVVTGFSSGSSPGVMFLLSAGLLTHSWITNNVASYNAGVEMRGNSTLENCAILDNRSTHSNFDQGAALRIPHGTGTKVVRNCTIAGNTFAKSGNAALYGYAWETAKERVYLYNNIFWDNTCTADGSVRNANNGASQKWFVKNNCWDYDTASKLQGPTGGTDFGSVLTDPLFDATAGAPWLSSASPCKNTGSDEYGTLAATDILGAPRRSDTHIEIGCVECQPAGFTASIWASATEARLPATITL